MADNSSLKGFLEKFEFGDGFVVLTGWATTAEGSQLQQPLTLRIEGFGQTSVPRFVFREDLSQAGLAGGVAAFSQSFRLDASVDGRPQVFAFTSDADEIPLSGPGTLYTPFKPTGAFDQVDADVITGWIYDPASDLQRRGCHLVLDQRYKVELGRRIPRFDLRLETDSSRMLGFTLALNSLDIMLQLARDAGRVHLALIAADNTVVAMTDIDLHPQPSIEGTPATSEKVNSSSPPDSITIKIERILIGNARTAVVGWVSYIDKTAIAVPLEFSMPGQHPVRVDELDLRSDLSRHGIAGGRAGFTVVFPSLGADWNTTALTVRAGPTTIVSQLSKATHSTEIASIGSSKSAVQGVYLDLETASRGSVCLAIGDHYETDVKLEARSAHPRHWGETGLLATGFSVSKRQILGRLRAQAPDEAFPVGFKVPIAIISSSDKVIETSVTLIEKAKGRIEVLNSMKVSGWLADASGQEVAEIDTFIEGVRYSTTRADRARSDLIKKKITTRGGGFHFEPSNPDVGTNICHIQINQAFTNEQLNSGSAVIELPSSAKPNTQQIYTTIMNISEANISIIVPIYNAPDDLRQCLESIIRNTNTSAKLILINDCSPDPRVEEVLDAVKHFTNIQILRNTENIGFTRTINRGIMHAGSNDVILLNSDTIVSWGWLQGLRIAAYSGPNIATATPLSNNAGVFSVPEINTENAIPRSFEIDDFGRLIRHASMVTLPRVPTGNGFCMYVRRRVIDVIGPLDETGFPVGYGEENDFCMRALRAGFEHVCDDRTFVFHRREASFGASKAIHYNHGRETLRSRYPEYQRLTPVFEHGSELLGVRWRVRKALTQTPGPSSYRPRIAFVISTTTGGTPQTNRDLMASLIDQYEPWVLRCDSIKIELSRFDGTSTIPVFTTQLRNKIEPALHRSAEYDSEVMQILIRFSIELVHIRHLAWHGLGLVDTCNRLGIPVVLSFHDFYAVCPTIKLLDENRTYCAGRCTSSGGDCTVELWQQNLFPVLKNSFVHRWREMFSSVFSSCQAFVTTSEQAREVYQDAFPELRSHRFHVIPHGRTFDAFEEAAVLPENAGPLKILVPGNVSPAKGADLIRDVLNLDVSSEVEFHILGDHGRLEERRGLILHGKYNREDFALRVREIAPAVGAVLSVWPETYCHTLTEMWASGIPVIGLDVGAVGERITQHQGGWLLPLESKASEILDLIRALRRSATEIELQISSVRAWQAGYAKSYNCEAMAERYTALYTHCMGINNPFKGSA